MNEELLTALTQAPGIAGHEDKVRDVVVSALRPLVDDIRIDTMGNVIATRNGTGGPRIMLAAHMDEIGFLVKFIDDKGFIRFQPVGGFDPRVLVAQRVLVHTRSDVALQGVLQSATKPIHLLQPGELSSPKLEDLFIDLGLSMETVKDQVSIGDMVTLDGPVQRTGTLVTSRALDDRLLVYVMIEALKRTETNAEIIAVATTQEEIGLRGAETAGYGVDPDIAIALDVTLANDIPGGAPELAVTRIGDGVGIKTFDSSQVPNRLLNNHLRELAEREAIPYQIEVLPRGGTDAGAIQRTRSGVITSTLSVPTRYIHTVNESASVADIEATIQLLAIFLAEADTSRYRYSI
ncbi:MAG: M42 family metallopeptidase [Thermomicrobiales bacterium]